MGAAVLSLGAVHAILPLLDRQWEATISAQTAEAKAAKKQAAIDAKHAAARAYESLQVTTACS